MKAVLAVALALLALGAVQPLGANTSGAAEAQSYTVVLAGTMTKQGFDLAGTHDSVLDLVSDAGGKVTNDLTRQIGALAVESANLRFDETLRASPLVAEAGEEFVWQGIPGASALQDDPLPPVGPGTTEETLEPFQWSMRQVCASQDPERPETCPVSAHTVQDGNPLVEVGILDSGVDASHPDFVAGGNIDCEKGADFTVIGTPTNCIDNQFHGTHVAGIVGAPRNGLGVVGVAPDVTLVPVKVCDTSGYCYANATAAGITHAGDMKFEVINMSFFVDDDQLLNSTEFKCMSDPIQRAFRQINERAIQYARDQGVVPVAALGNSDNNLADPPDPYENECEVVPAETQGVIGTMALGRQSEKAHYSNYGNFATDVAAPGGSYAVLDDGPTEFCEQQVLSTVPQAFGFYGCFQGTSMASPHAAGVAALIVSEFGSLGSDGDWKMSPTKVEQYLQSTTVDIGESGYDKCFGNGRINALRAVLHNTSGVYEGVPECTELD